MTTTSLSTQDEIWSQLFLLFLQDSPPKPKIKKLAKALTPPETYPWEPDAYLKHSSSRYHCIQEGGSLVERRYLKQLLVTPEQEQRAFWNESQLSPSYWPRILLRACDVSVTPWSLSQYVTQFLSVSSNNIIHIVLLTQVNSSIVSDLLYIRSLTDKFSFSIMLSAAF